MGNKTRPSKQLKRTKKSRYIQMLKKKKLASLNAIKNPEEMTVTPAVNCSPPLASSCPTFCLAKNDGDNFCNMDEEAYQERKLLAQAQANDGAQQSTTNVSQPEAGSLHQHPAMPGPSTLSTFPLPLPNPSSNTVPCSCKMERDDYEEEGVNYDQQEFSTTTEPSSTSSVLNPISQLTSQPARLPDGTLMVPLPMMEHRPIKQEIDDDNVQPLYVDLNHPLNVPYAPPRVHVPHQLKGHRVVDIAHLIEWCIDLKVDHLKDCPQTDLKIIGELRDGLRSDFVFHCDECGFETVKSSMNPNKGTAILRRLYAWKDSLKRSNWLFVQRMLNMFSIPFKA